MPKDEKDHIYRVVELAGTSGKSIEDAIATAIARANKTIRDLRWFEVVQTRGHIENGKVAHFQALLRLASQWKSRNDFGMTYSLDTGWNGAGRARGG